MYVPYTYQADCLGILDRLRADGAKTALVVMASGIGKTVTVALDVKHWLTKNQGRVLYLCHQTDILYQAKDTMEDVLGPTRSYGFFHGSAKDLHSVDCLFASFQTMEKNCEVFDPSEFAYIVVDECHHVQAETYRRVVEYFRPSFLLGVTATPNRMDLRDIREIFGKEVFFLPLDEALAQNLVTPLDYRLMIDEISLEALLPQNLPKRLSLKRLNRSIFVPKRDEEIARIIARDASEFDEPRIIVFCPSIPYCNHFASFVPDSFTLHSSIPEKERRVRLELFRQGMVNTILTVDAFNEGVDIPQANVIVFLCSTDSPTIFLQQLGRGLRRSKGKEKVIVRDFVGNCERIKMVYDLWESVEGKLANIDHAGHAPSAKPNPMTLDLDHPGFRERMVRMQDILERLQPKFVSDLPELLAEYSPKNLELASKVLAGTSKRLWWKCSKPGCGHEWQTSGSNRSSNGSGCPACVSKTATPTNNNNLEARYPELAKEYSTRNPLLASQIYPRSGKKLWWKCSNPDCGHEWQAVVANRTSSGNGCPACSGRVVSNKGNPGTDPGEQDNKQVPTRVKKKVWWRCTTCKHEWEGGIRRIASCPACGSETITKRNKLATTHPELVKEYSTRNELTADQVMAGTGKKLWWKCSKCGHEWQATGSDRVQGSGCKICSGRFVSTTNNLATTHPSLALEYSSKNELPATKVLAGSATKFWWKCSNPDCGHEWQARGASRARGVGCPACAKLKRGPSISKTLAQKRAKQSIG